MAIGSAKRARASIGPSRAEPFFDERRQPHERLLGLARAAREPIERFGVEALLGEAGDQRPQARARVSRIGVGRVLDERDAARAAKGDEVALLYADEGPDDRHAVPRRRCVDAAQARDARAAEETKQHCFPLIVGMMRGQERVGPDCARVIDEKAVSRLPPALLDAAQGLCAFPDERAMLEPEPAAERGDALGLRGAFRTKPMIDGGGLDANLSAPRRPIGGHQEERGRIGPAGDGDQQRLGADQRRKQRVDLRRRKMVCAFFYSVSAQQ